MASENTCPALRLRIDSAIVGFCEVNRVEGGHRTIRFCNGRAAGCRPTPSDALVPPKLLMVHHKLRPLAALRAATRREAFWVTPAFHGRRASDGSPGNDLIRRGARGLEHWRPASHLACDQLL